MCGGLSSALDYARHDGKLAAGWVNDRVQEVLAIPKEDIVSRRRRTPAPTQLLKLFENVRTGAMSPEEAADHAEELFRKWGESEETIREVMKPLHQEIQAIQPTSDERPRKRPVYPYEPRPAIGPTRRLRFLRDPTGQIRIVEEF